MAKKGGSANMAQLIKQIAISGEELYTLAGKVTEVDEEARTCIVELISGGADVTDVRLQANTDQDAGGVNIPAVGSDVLVTFLSRDDGYVSLFTDISKTLLVLGNISFELSDNKLSLNIGGKTYDLTKDGHIFNGGSLGGMVKADELKTQVDKNTAVLSAIQLILSGPPIPEAGLGAPSALQASLNVAAGALPTADLSDIKNPDVKH